MVRSVSESDSANDRTAHVESAALDFVDEINIDLLDCARPAVEAEHLIGKIDGLLCCQIVERSISAWARSRGNVFRAELLLEFAL